MKTVLWAAIEVLLLAVAIRPIEIIFSRQRNYQYVELRIAVFQVTCLVAAMILVGILAST